MGSLFRPSSGRVPSLLRFPLLLVTLIPVGALLQLPNPIDELRRLTGNHLGETDWSTSPGRPIDGWTIDHLNATYNEFLLETERTLKTLNLSRREVMYFGYHGNTVELVTGVENGTGIASPESLRFGGNQVSLACAPIYKRLPLFVIVYDTDFPCDGYEGYPMAEVNKGLRVFRKIP